MKHLISCAALACAGVLFADLPTPLSSWSFEDAENLGVDTQSNNTLTAAIANTSDGTPASLADGHSGLAVSLRRGSTAGNALVGEVGKLPTGTNPFTVSAWIRPQSGTSSEGYILLDLGIVSGVPQGWDNTGVTRWSGWYLRFGGNGRLALCFGDWRGIPSATDSSDLVGTIPSGAYYSGTWHHVAFSRDAAGLTRLYWDGLKIAEGTISYSVNAKTRLIVGCYETGNAYNGDYDEITCWDSALTEQQVVSAYLLGRTDVSEDGRIILHADAGESLTNAVSYDGGTWMEKTGAGSVALFQTSSGYRGSVGVTNGLLRTGNIGTLENASAIAVEDGATFEFGRSADSAAAFSGTGTLRFSGLGVCNLTGTSAGFTGTWQNYFGTVNFGTTNKPVTPQAVSSLDVAGGGFLAFKDNVTVAALAGQGVLGGVSVPDGKTLTVVGASDTAFAGRLEGRGSLVKNGSGTLTLSGAGAFTNVTVAAGTLGLGSNIPFDRAGLRGYWNFEDAANVGADASADGSAPLAVDAYGTPSVQLVDDGVSGKAIHIAEPSTTNSVGGFYLKSQGCGNLPKGTEPFTVSFWLRPRDNISGTSYIMRHSSVLSGSVTNLDSTGWASGWMIAGVNGGTRLVFTPLSGWRDPSKVTDAAVGAGSLSLDTWHHIVGTRDGNTWTLYLDGACIGSYTYTSGMYYDVSTSSSAVMQIGAYCCYTQPYNAVDADYDEVQYFAGAWTAEQVAAEYAAKTPKAGVVLPAPVAAWTFDEIETDDKGRYFRDHSGTGWNFYEVQKNAGTVQCLDSSSALVSGVNGGAVYVNSANYGAYLKVGDYVSPKETITAANPDYTLSIRLRNVENGQGARQVYLSLGSAQQADMCFRLSKESMNESTGTPWIYRILPGNANSKEGWILEDTYVSKGAESPWCTLTFVNKASSKQVTVYRDGNAIGSYATDYGLNLDRILLYAGYNYNTYSGYAVDDLRIYTNLLNQAQVRTLVYEQAGVKPGPLASANVTVASGAAVQVTAGDHVADALSGAGPVTVAKGAAFGARAYANYAGSLSGDGALLIADGAKCPLAAEKVALASARFADDTLALTVADAAHPFVSFNGQVELPATGTLKLTDATSARTWPGKRFLLANCASYSGPMDTAGWTFVPASEDGDAISGKFVFASGKLWLRMAGGGLTIIFR